MAYRLSRKAEEDIIQIYVSSVEILGADQADRYHEDLERTFAFLSDFPLAAAQRPDLRDGSRVHPCRSHIIIYRLDGPNILIQRVRHAGEDWLGQP